MTGLRICIVALSLIPSVALAQEPTRVDIGVGPDFVYEPAAIGMGLGVRVGVNIGALRHVNPLIDIGLSSSRVAVMNTGTTLGTGSQRLRHVTVLGGVRIAPPRNTAPYAHLLVGMRSQFLSSRGAFSAGAYVNAKREFSSTDLVFQPAGGVQFALSQRSAVRAEAGLVVGRNKPLEHYEVEPRGLVAWRFAAVVVMSTGRP
jgi:hypothetical protein